MNNKQEIAFMMWKDKRPIKDIANSLGVSCTSVYKYIEREKYLRSEAATHEKKEYDPEKLRKEIESGLTVKQLAVRYGIGENTIRRRCKKHGILYGKDREEEYKGKNADRHLCRTCCFRMSNKTFLSVGMRCDYIGINERSRRCSAVDCDKYEKGKPKKEKASR